MQVPVQVRAVSEGDMAMTTEQIEAFKARLIEKGEEAVRDALLIGEYNAFKSTLAMQFLAAFDAERDAERRREDLSVGRKANELAEEANRIAKKANWWAKWALVISLLAVAIAT